MTSSSGNRSIIKIDVDDEEFKRFAAVFERFRSHIKSDVPRAWQAVDAAIKKTSNPVKQLQTILAGVRAQMLFAKNTQEKFTIAAQASGRALKVVYNYAKTIAKSMGAAVKSLLKFASYAAIFSAGGLFGLDRLAVSAGESRRESQGLGVSPGERAAAKVNFEKLVDVDATLAKIQDARTDLTKRYTLNAVGLSNQDIDTKDNAELLKELLPLLKKKYEQTGGTLQAAEANGLTQFADISTLTRLHAVREDEIRASQEAYERDKIALGVADSTQRAWQNFAQQLDRSGYKIQNALIDGLSGLTGPMTELSDAVANAIKIFLQSDTFKKWIHEAGEAIQKFAKYLASDDFQHDVQNVLAALDEFGGALISVARMLGKTFSLGNEKGLTASQYRKLDELQKLDPKLERAVEHALKNPVATKGNEFSWWSLSHQGADLNDAVAQAMKGSNSDQIKSLLNGLISTDTPQQRSGQVTQQATPAETIKAVQQAVKSTPSAGSAPLPERQNNPFDMRPWKGTTYDQANGFLKFDTEQQGVTAGFKNLLYQQDHYQKSTVKDIISRYAPKEDGNDTDAYISRVSKMTGFDPNQQLDLHDPKTLEALGRAIMKEENGNNKVTSEEIRTGVEAALASSTRKQMGAAATAPAMTAATSGRNSSSGGTLPPANVNVTIQNNTGGDTHTIVNGLAAAQ